MTVYYTGDPVTLTTATQPFALAATPTVPLNPTTVVVTVTDPAGTVTTPTVTNGTAGVYTSSFTCSVVGRWKAKIVGTGAVQKTATVDWDVEAP